VLERLGAVGFRCLKDLALEASAGTNVIVGDNGAGKTSLLEAIYLLGRGRSFRSPALANLVTTGQSALAVSGRVRTADNRTRTLSLRWSGGGTAGTIDHRSADGLAELARVFPVEIIDTRVQELVRGSPGERRRFLDWGVFHVEQPFLAAWRRFSRALRQRNAALRQDPSARLARPWDGELAQSGTEIDAARRAYVQQLSDGLQDVVEDLLGGTVGVRYLRGWPSDLSLAEALARSGDRDGQRGQTSVGPHRADLEIRFDGQPAREHASGGQQKLIACALVLGQVRLVAETLGHSPVLLIDDPGAEVADRRLDRLMGWVESLCEQRFVTGLSTAVLGGGADAVFHVEHGTVTRVK
jgi:DNA replication and repair protein RecF